jgi:VanZ family protein
MRSNFLKNCTALKQNFLKYWLPVILWMGVIFGVSTGTFSSEQTSRFIVPLLHFLFPWLSPQYVDLIHGLIRKAGHVAEYFILGLLLFRAFRSDSSQGWRPRWAIYAVVGVIIYAVSDEFHQSFVAARGASLVDVGIDSAGGIFSQIAVMLRHLLRKK